MVTPTNSEISISSNETSMQMLDILQSMMGEMVKKIHPRKQLGIQDFHHWKAVGKRLKNISSVYSQTGEKVLFQNSIQKFMGIEKTTGFPLKTRRF